MLAAGDGCALADDGEAVAGFAGARRDSGLDGGFELACRRIGVGPLWLHRGSCQTAQLGARPAPLTDWMAARRLDVEILSDRGAVL
ncbi:hypothetical protein ACWC4C_33315 [Streptomyces olivaceoviridis]